MSILHSHDLVGDSDDVNEEQLPHGLQIGIRREVKVVHGVSSFAAQQCEDDIMDLKEQLDNKEKELTALRKRVKDLEANNNHLQFQLEKKCDEVKSLNERIHKLEDEKKTLEEELSSVKVNLKNIKEEVDALTRSKESQETKNVELEGSMRMVQFSLNEVEEDLAKTKEQNQQLKAEVQKVRNQQRYVQGATLRLPLPASDQDFAMKSLSDLSCHIQNGMYKKVLPDHYTPVVRYTIKMIEKDIKRLPKTEAEQKEAMTRWESLKTELDWNDVKTEVLHSLRESRNAIECSTDELDEKLLRDCTDYLQKENILKGWLSLDHITALIDVWKKLK